MKTLFIEARRKACKIDYSALDSLKKFDKIGVVYSVQYKDAAEKIKEKLGGKAILGGQVLGCDVSNAKKMKSKVNAFLLIGSGRFHALSIAMLGKKTFIFNPESKILDEISEDEVKRMKTRKEAALMKFYAADKIGIIVSLKPGQENMKSALELKKKLEAKGKKAFIFVCENINEAELENFDCGMWVNTACQALNMEPKILNIIEISGF